MVFLRYVLYILVALAFITIAPAEWADKVHFSFTTTVFLFSFIIAFLVNRTMERKRIMRENLNVELSRLRRVHHIGEYLGTKKWRHELNEAITQYQLVVSQDITNYPEANQSYRAFSHLIYSYNPKSRREEILFEELLDTTRDLALGRQKIQRGLQTWIEPYPWIIISIISGLLLFLLLFAQENEVFTRLAVGAAVISVLLSLDLLRHTNKFTRVELANLQGKYQVNIPDKQEPNHH